MNNTNYDPEKFDVDEYGNLYPKQDGFIDDEEEKKDEPIES